MTLRWGRRLLRLRRATLFVMAVVVSAAAGVLLSPGMSQAHYTKGEDHFASDCNYLHHVCRNGTYLGTEKMWYAHKCGKSPHTKVCITRKGDRVMVKDLVADGHSAVARVGGVRDRDGEPHWFDCRNRTGKGTWVVCDFNWRDSDGNRLRYTVSTHKYEPWDNWMAFEYAMDKYGRILFFDD